MLTHFLLHFQECRLEKVQSVKRSLVGGIQSLVLHFKLQLLEVVLYSTKGQDNVLILWKRGWGRGLPGKVALDERSQVV